MSITISNNLNNDLQKDAENIKNIFNTYNNSRINGVINGGAEKIRIRVISGQINKKCLEQLLSQYSLDMVNFDDKEIYLYV